MTETHKNRQEIVVPVIFTNTEFSKYKFNVGETNRILQELFLTQDSTLKGGLYAAVMSSALLRAVLVDDNAPRILGQGPCNNWGAIKNQSINARKKGGYHCFLKTGLLTRQKR